MAGIDGKEFIDELKFCLGEEDVVKAKALLQFASDSNVDVSVQEKAMQELAKGPEKVVFPLLEYLTKIEISDPKIQDALYDLILDKAYGNTALVIDYITNNDKHPRLLFLKAAGDLSLVETADILEQIISDDTDIDILVQATISLGMLRQEKSIPLLSSIVDQDDLKLRRAAIFGLAEIGGKDVVDSIFSFITGQEETDKIAVEALAEMQDLYSLEKITTLLNSTETIVRDTAIDALMKLGNKSVPILTKAFENAEADYLVHLITTLGYIGDQSAISSILDIINTQPEDANIRQAAYEAMERIPSPKTAICLAQGLQDPVEAVRMSAARAIDKNLSKALVAGLKNIVREKSQDSKNAVAALIDCEASNIFNFLVGEESFVELASIHAVEKADPISRENFLKHMKGLGQKDLVEQISNKISDNPDKSAGSLDSDIKIFVVDDSKMMLRLYQNKLGAVGYKPVLFQLPEEAIPAIITQKPNLVITDLNMPNISGLELTREIRKKFSKQDLPILMITTQSDFVEEKDGDIRIDDSVLTKSGINKILHKPFTDEIFNETISQFLKK